MILGDDWNSDEVLTGEKKEKEKPSLWLTSTRQSFLKKPKNECVQGPYEFKLGSTA